MDVSLASSPVLAPFVRFLSAPDAPRGVVASEPAAALAVGMLGTGLFAGALGWALDAGLTDGGGGSPLSVVPAFLVGVPLAQVLCFPPLLLWSTLRGQSVPPLRLAAVATAGPGALGLWLGATAPIFLLYGLTGAAPEGIDRHLPLIAIGLLAVATTMVGVWVGALNALRAGRALRMEAPGGLGRLLHYVTVLWTTAILVYRLS